MNERLRQAVEQGTAERREKERLEAEKAREQKLKEAEREAKHLDEARAWVKEKLYSIIQAKIAAGDVRKQYDDKRTITIRSGLPSYNEFCFSERLGPYMAKAINEEEGLSASTSSTDWRDPEMGEGTNYTVKVTFEV